MEEEETRETAQQSGVGRGADLAFGVGQRGGVDEAAEEGNISAEAASVEHVLVGEVLGDVTAAAGR